MFHESKTGADGKVEAPTKDSYVKLKHVPFGYVHPFFGKTDNETPLVFHHGDVSDIGGPHHCKFRFVEDEGG